MIQRCQNHENKYYGGRGIKVCLLWRNSFEAFWDWALSSGYDDTKTIDRIDSSKNYFPSNCRWISHAEQNRNKPDNLKLTIGKKTLCITEWSRRSGISHSTIARRLDRGWSPRKAVFTSLERNGHHKFLTINGQTKSVFYWAKKFGVTPSTAYRRLERGLDIDEIFAGGCNGM